MTAEILKILWPMTGVLFGGGVSGIAFLLVWRRMAPLQTQAMNGLVETQSIHLSELKTERDEYRNKLHEANGNGQALALRIKELELRPDLSTIAGLLTGQNDLMLKIGLSLEEHSSEDKRIFQNIEQSLSSIAVKLAP